MYRGKNPLKGKRLIQNKIVQKRKNEYNDNNYYYCCYYYLKSRVDTSVMLQQVKLPPVILASHNSTD